MDRSSIGKVVGGVENGSSYSVEGVSTSASDSLSLRPDLKDDVEEEADRYGEAVGVDNAIVKSEYHVEDVEDSPNTSSSDSETVNNPSLAGSCILICRARARRGE